MSGMHEDVEVSEVVCIEAGGLSLGDETVPRPVLDVGRRGSLWWARIHRNRATVYDDDRGDQKNRRSDSSHAYGG